MVGYDGTAAKREWRLLNPERTRIQTAVANANRRARIHGITDRITVKDVKELLGDDPECVYCGTLDGVGIDHIVSMSKGGANTLGNLQACCVPCNSSKREREAPLDSWSLAHEACVVCGSTSSRHEGRGVCSRCTKRRRRAHARV